MSHFPQQLRGLPKYEGAFDAFKLSAQGCDVLFASYPAGTSIPIHHHETENVGVVTQGEMILMIDGVEQSFGPGEWYHIEARGRHAARFESESSTIEFWLKRDFGAGATASALK